MLKRPRWEGKKAPGPRTSLIHIGTTRSIGARHAGSRRFSTWNSASTIAVMTLISLIFALDKNFL